MGERIAEEQERHSLIIDGTPRAPQIANNVNVFTFWPIYIKKNLYFGFWISTQNVLLRLFPHLTCKLI